MVTDLASLNRISDNAISHPNGNRTEISTTGTIESLAMRYKHTERFRFLVLIVKNQRLHVVKTQQ